MSVPEIIISFRQRLETLGFIRVTGHIVQKPDFEDFIQRLEASVRVTPMNVIVSRHFNAKHHYWNSPNQLWEGGNTSGHDPVSRLNGLQSLFNSDAQKR